MAILPSDIKIRLSGGSTNTNPNLSLGGVKSSTELVDNSLYNLWDQVTNAECSAGDLEYRCLYVHNGHATLTMQTTVIYISQNTLSTTTTFDIALAGEGLNGTAETVANETTAPVGESFSSPSSYATGLSMGNIPPGQHYAYWIRRTVNALSPVFDNDTAVIRVD